MSTRTACRARAHGVGNGPRGKLDIRKLDVRISFHLAHALLGAQVGEVDKIVDLSLDNLCLCLGGFALQGLLLGGHSGERRPAAFQPGSQHVLVHRRAQELQALGDAVGRIGVNGLRNLQPYEVDCKDVSSEGGNQTFAAGFSSSSSSSFSAKKGKGPRPDCDSVAKLKVKPLLENV
eukprot:scaffold223649_cov48-Prasinocladus_malaysianus.AAC.1